MNAPFRCLLVTALLTGSSVTALPAQILHVNDHWKDCAFVLDPSLTPQAWHQFVAEAGLVTYFRSLSSAKPLGKRHFEVAVLNWATRIDATDAAWNDTFSHPDSTHYLIEEGQSLPIPGLMLRVGATDRLDVGAYFTKNPNANYGIVGAQVQYNLLNDERRELAMAGRVNVASLFGPDDLSLAVYGVDLVVSKDVSVFSPYVGVSGYLSRGRERTTKVDLETELVAGAQAMAGVAVRVSALSLGAEVNLARKPGYSLKVGFGL